MLTVLKVFALSCLPWWEAKISFNITEEGQKFNYTHLEAASLSMKAFLGEVNEMRAAEDMEEEDALSSEGPAPIDRSCKEKAC